MEIVENLLCHTKKYRKCPALRFRKVMREAFGQIFIREGVHVRTVFMLGHSANATLMDQVHKVRCPRWAVVTDRAGHLSYFLIFSLIKNDFLHFVSS